MNLAFEEFSQDTGVTSDQMTRQLNALLSTNPEKYFEILQRINERKCVQIKIECLRETDSQI